MMHTIDNNSMMSGETLAQAILDQAVEAIVVCDAGGQIIRANERAYALCGQNPVGQMFQHVFDLQSAGSSPFSLNEPLFQEKQRIEARLTHQGEERDLLLSIGPLVGSHKERLGTVITLTDISQRKQAEKEILAAQTELKNLLAEADQSRRALLSLVEDQQQAEAALQERLKEMACLYAIRRDMSLELTTEQLCRRIVDHLMIAMQFPDIAVPYIELDGQQYTSEKYSPDLAHSLSTEIVVGGKRRGQLCLFYSQPKPFLIPEEQDLLNAISEALQLWLARQQAEADRRKSEQLLNETQAISKIGGWEYDLQRESISWTDEVYRIYGVEKTFDPNDIEAALGFFFDKERDHFEQALMKAVTQGQPYELELQFMAADGRQKWVYTSGKPVFHEERVIKVVGNIMDITERKQHEREQAAVVTVSAALRQVQSQAEILPIILDQLLILLQADGAALALYDPATDTAVVKEARGEFSPSLHIHLPLDSSLSGTVISSGKPFITTDLQQETGFYRADLRGNMRAAACVPLLVQEEVIGTIWVSRPNEFSPAELRLLTAITDMAANAIHRTTLYEKTQAQAEQIYQIINSAPDGVLLLDEQHKILLANPSAREFLTLLADVAVGDSLTHLGDRHLEELLTSPPVGHWHHITEQKKTFEAIARPVVAGPIASGWVLVLRDVTERRLVQEQLQQQERLAAIGQLAAGIAHDFNNLMAIIILYTQLVSHSPGLSERDQERLATIKQQANHATRMIQQILDFSRRSLLERQVIDLHLLLKEQVELLRRTLPENIEIILQAEKEEYLAEVDSTRIQQAIMNLAVNARDALPEGGRLTLRLTHIEVSAKENRPLPTLAAGKWIQLTIADTGTGIVAEHLDHLFEPFFTTKPPDKGTGLGLAQVHGIVAQHGGEIIVTSQMGQGTTFTIYLPALLVIKAATDIEDITDLPQGRGELLLVVEDNETLRTALVDYLQKWGYRTVEAAQGEEALVHLAEPDQEIALILSDAVMPRMGGIKLFHTLRQQGNQTPIILMSGHPLQEEAMATMRAAGLLNWLTKPPDLTQLAQAIATALAERGKK
jgi:two-component system, cell cycle sensor histidine kinase and response regulator CckA